MSPRGRARAAPDVVGALLRILIALAEERDARRQRAAAVFAARVTPERRVDLAEARFVLTLAEALARSPDAVALLLAATASDTGAAGESCPGVRSVAGRC
jgi:hypothetical protein